MRLLRRKESFFVDMDGVWLRAFVVFGFRHFFFMFVVFIIQELQHRTAAAESGLPFIEDGPITMVAQLYTHTTSV